MEKLLSPNAFQLRTRKEEYLRFLSDIAIPIDQWIYRPNLYPKGFVTELPSKTDPSIIYKLYFIDNEKTASRGENASIDSDEMFSLNPLGKLDCIIFGKLVGIDKVDPVGDGQKTNRVILITVFITLLAIGTILKF